MNVIFPTERKGKGKKEGAMVAPNKMMKLKSKSQFNF
jgi:hypothetical protein